MQEQLNIVQPQSQSWKRDVSSISKRLAFANDCKGFEAWFSTLPLEHRQFAQSQFENFSKINFPYVRIGTLPIDFVLQNAGEDVMTSYGVIAKCSSWRINLYAAKGVTCSCCGISGTMFALERRREQNGGFHLNLYHVDANGRESMITVDHIIPKSKGGGNQLSNLQPMCFTCNTKKADTVPQSGQVA